MGILTAVSRWYLVAGAVLHVGLAGGGHEAEQLGDGVVVGQPPQLGLRDDQALAARGAVDLHRHRKRSANRKILED